VRIAIVGAGAIGAFVGAALARGGADVHLLARGANFAALRERGIQVRSPRGDFHEHPHVTDDAREIGPVDVVFLGLKAHQYATAGPLLGPLMTSETMVIAAQNGIPWWYFHGLDGPYQGRRIESVDPSGAVSTVIPPARAVGCVVYCSTELEAPGVVRHVYGTRLTIGEPDGTRSERCVAFSEAMVAGGLKCPVVSDIRDDVWVKLMGNAVFNPLSALTRATMVSMCQDRPLRRAAATAMAEILEIARATGADPQVSIERRLTGAESVGEHRTSTLQDLEAGKTLELEAIADAVVELADLTSVEAPTLRTIAAASGMLASTLGLREEPIAAATQPARGG
jgi:2-dehydropantoate 2-reductase